MERKQNLNLCYESGLKLKLPPSTHSFDRLGHDSSHAMQHHTYIEDFNNSSRTQILT